VTGPFRRALNAFLMIASFLAVILILQNPVFAKPTPSGTPTPTPTPMPTPSPKPFWKAKPAVYKKIKEDRFIVVSAKVDDEDGKKKLSLLTAGHINAPVDFVHEHVMKFGSYSKFLPYIEESSYDAKTKNVFLHGALLGYHVRMTLHVESKKTENGHQLDWESIAGGLIGMKGRITEERLEANVTEISMDVLQKAESLGIPGFILNWGLEFAGHRAAGNMRSHIESEWKKAKNN
jgi:hypothetical protein